MRVTKRRAVVSIDLTLCRNSLKAMELYCKGLVGSEKERPWSGYCAFNLATMCEKYVCNELALLPEDLSREDSPQSQQDRVKLKRKSAAIRVRLGELMGESLKKDDVAFMIRMYELSTRYGCAKGGAQIARLEEKMRRREELVALAELVDTNVLPEHRALSVGSGVKVGDGEVDEEKKMGR